MLLPVRGGTILQLSGDGDPGARLLERKTSPPPQKHAAPDSPACSSLCGNGFLKAGAFARLKCTDEGCRPLDATLTLPNTDKCHQKWSRGWARQGCGATGTEPGPTLKVCKAGRKFAGAQLLQETQPMFLKPRHCPVAHEVDQGSAFALNFFRRLGPGSQRVAWGGHRIAKTSYSLPV